MPRNDATPASANAPSPTRRAILSALPAAAIGIGAVKASRAAAAHPDAALIALGRELEDLHAIYLAELASDDEDPTYDRHWQIRGLIEAIRAKTSAGLRIKARAVQMSLERDPGAECTSPGSFIELSKSLARDVIASPALAIGGAHV
jgi:hypothetical protein